MGMKQAAGTYHYAPSRRRWGQNFLRDRGVADRILSAIAPGPGDLFLEIGPGEGALTEGLAAAAEAVAAVEIDPLMASILREGLAKRHRNLVVLQADALEIGPEEILQHLGREPGDGSRLRLAGSRGSRGAGNVRAGATPPRLARNKSPPARAGADGGWPTFPRAMPAGGGCRQRPTGVGSRVVPGNHVRPTACRPPGSRLGGGVRCKPRAVCLGDAGLRAV